MWRRSPGPLGVVGVGTALFTYGFLSEYGTTSGSRVDGAVNGLKFAAVPLLATGALAAAAFGLGRRSTWVRGLAVAVVLLRMGGALGSWGAGRIRHYDGLPRLPHCKGAPPAVETAFAGLEHPGPFGAVASGIDGCSAVLLNVTLDEAAAHYVEDDARVTARRDDLVFVLAEGCGSVAVEIKLAGAAATPVVC